jgi:hypothetical protein
MEKSIAEKYEKAKSISDSVMLYAKPLVKEDALALDVAEKIENKIKALGGGLAFPVNISINENAAHYTPDIADLLRFKADDLAKIDMGVHIDGYIWDRAFTVCIGQKMHPLIEAAEKALEESMKAIKPGARIFEISEIVESVLDELGFNPIRNLCGPGLEIREGKSFFFDSTFDNDLGKRLANKTEENVTKDYRPFVPEHFRKAEYVYVGNSDPVQNMEVLRQMEKPKLTVCDTINYWILNKRLELIKMFGMVDVVVVNDEEARLISKNANLIKCARNIMDWGPEMVIIKKGEHGAILFKENCDLIFPAPGYPLEDIVDPTGAGDSFAGGFIGHIERSDKNHSNNHGNIPEKTLKEAVVYGNVMGSFAVEDFSVNRFLNLTMREIEERFEKYRNFVYF